MNQGEDVSMIEGEAPVNAAQPSVPNQGPAEAENVK